MNDNNLIIDLVKEGISVKGNVKIDLKHTLACGQCFHYFEEEDGSYTIVSSDKFVNVLIDNQSLLLRGSNLEDVRDYWLHYFDLNRDYKALEEELMNKDQYLKRAIEFASGLHILNQDPYDMVMAFIISANNNIKRIRQIIRTLSENYGPMIGEYNGRKLYGFPNSEILMNLSLESLRQAGLGYRDKYIKKTAEMIQSGQVDLDKLRGMSLEEIEKSLMGFSGVGKKVADCIALFAYGKADAFPVDTWVKKIMVQYYDVDYKNQKMLDEFVQEYFGKYAGFAQQYLFYHIRLES